MGARQLEFSVLWQLTLYAARTEFRRARLSLADRMCSASDAPSGQKLCIVGLSKVANWVFAFQESHNAKFRASFRVRGIVRRLIDHKPRPLLVKLSSKPSCHYRQIVSLNSPPPLYGASIEGLICWARRTRIIGALTTRRDDDSGGLTAGSCGSSRARPQPPTPGVAHPQSHARSRRRPGSHNRSPGSHNRSRTTWKQTRALPSARQQVCAHSPLRWWTNLACPAQTISPLAIGIRRICV